MVKTGRIEVTRDGLGLLNVGNESSSASAFGCQFSFLLDVHCNRKKKELNSDGANTIQILT